MKLSLLQFYCPSDRHTVSYQPEECAKTFMPSRQDGLSAQCWVGPKTVEFMFGKTRNCQKWKNKAPLASHTQSNTRHEEDWTGQGTA